MATLPMLQTDAVSMQHMAFPVFFHSLCLDCDLLSLCTEYWALTISFCILTMIIILFFSDAGFVLSQNKMFSVFSAKVLQLSF